MLFFVFAFADAVRSFRGWGVGQPMRFLVGAALTGVGVAGSGVAARLAWSRPERSHPMILAASLCLVATGVGGLLVLRSLEFYVMPRVGDSYSARGVRSAAPKATVNRSHQMTTVS